MKLPAFGGVVKGMIFDVRQTDIFATKQCLVAGPQMSLEHFEHVLENLKAPMNCVVLWRWSD